MNTPVMFVSKACIFSHLDHSQAYAVWTKSVKSNLLCILNFLDFNHVCNIIISNNGKSILKFKYAYKEKLSDLIPGYEVNPTRFSHGSNKVIS